MSYDFRDVDSGTYTVSEPSENTCTCTVLRCDHPGLCLGTCGCRACQPRSIVHVLRNICRCPECQTSLNRDLAWRPPQ